MLAISNSGPLILSWTTLFRILTSCLNKTILLGHSMTFPVLNPVLDFQFSTSLTFQQHLGHLTFPASCRGFLHLLADAPSLGSPCSFSVSFVSSSSFPRLHPWPPPFFPTPWCPHPLLCLNVLYMLISCLDSPLESRLLYTTACSTSPLKYLMGAWNLNISKTKFLNSAVSPKAAASPFQLMAIPSCSCCSGQKTWLILKHPSYTLLPIPQQML